MNNKWRDWRNGVKDGVPVAFAYFAVSFTFGIIAKQMGLTQSEAGFMSATNVTSAGQFAGVTLISATAAMTELAFTQLIINSRYFLMSFALSQKIDPSTPLFHRLLMAFGITDEVFGMSMASPGKLSPYYTYGIMCLTIPGWVLGTLSGVVSETLLPDRMMSALSIALYGMLLAVIIPPARGNRAITGIIAMSMGLSLLFAVLPVLGTISTGVKIIVLTVIIAGLAAYHFPLKEPAHE